MTWSSIKGAKRHESFPAKEEDLQIENKVYFAYENDWIFFNRNVSIDMQLSLEDNSSDDISKHSSTGTQLQVNNTVLSPQCLPSVNDSILNSLRSDGIIDLYCDDELRMSLEFEKHHLGLGLIENNKIGICEGKEDDLLSITAEKNFEESLEEIQIDWNTIGKSDHSDCRQEPTTRIKISSES